ncbi:uncharacterized protein N7503_000437 [Penicillium pulvis]|uniref:uncharacterized protein n=1 Tax=Penicillium pulvis TaxID=1562058 RepID=UPI002547B507|nr:uncharacterized protein N7503_000437 [Penicillium pulvis]KAJ5813687.1 hypothetical protein N7503_000437 [Penicillium pulvis]
MDSSDYNSRSSSSATSYSDIAETSVEQQNDLEVAVDNEHYDIISFTSLVSQLIERAGLMALLINMVHISPSNIQLSDKRRKGSYFSVSLINRQKFQRVLPEGIADIALPQLIAVKTPILDQNLQLYEKRQIFASMMNEYRILNHKSITKHKNIVKILGCCWRTVDVDTDHVIPNLVLEGTSLGDLDAFYRLFHEKTSMRRRLGLCIDIAKGVEALHLAGIVHGDIKPQNVLVFKDKHQGFVAKIADFGSSTFIDHDQFPRKAFIGTPAFTAPECLDHKAEFSEQGLLKADIFALAITLLFLVRGPFILDKLLAASDSDQENLTQYKRRGELNGWLNRDERILPSTQAARKAFGKEALERKRQQSVWDWLNKQTDLMKQARFEMMSQRQKVPEDISGNWNPFEKMTLQNERCENMFSHLIDQMTCGEPMMRIGSMCHIVRALQQVLRLELHDLSQINLAAREELENDVSIMIGLEESLQHRQSMKLELNLREINDVISSTTNPFRELRFIWKFGMIASFPQKCPLYPKLFHRKGKPSKRKGPSAFIKSQRAKVVTHMWDICKAWGRKHERTRLIGIKKDEMVFRASMNEKYTSYLPVSVRREITKQLRNVADSVQESETRRVLASFEYSVMILCYPDTWKTKPSPISTALHCLHLAAASGYHHAQSVAGRLHYAFGSAMPESVETEVEWLSQASMKGSLTAMQRLRLLDPSHHLKISRLIRFEYQGSFFRDALWSDTELLLRAIPSGYDVPPYFIHNLAAHGQSDSLKRLCRLPPRHFNMTDRAGETPLVTACRCGHADVVELLLELGADPTIATYRDIHPLHFLGAFEDRHIPRVTKLLLTNGAILEAHCSQGDTYRQGIDGRFDVEAGTPLLWAVIAGNIQAINSLLDWGANIFAYQRLVPQDFTNDVYIDSSPLESAITKYRFDIVEILLASCKDIQLMRGKLNELRLVGPNIRASPLLHALNRPKEDLMRIALTHGWRVQDAQLMTVATLMRYGSSLLEISREVSGQSINPTVLICEVNNLPLLRFIWNRDGGIYRPSNTRIFIECIGTAIQYSNKDVFDFLVTHKDDLHLDDDEQILDALAKVCNMSDNEHYVSSLVELACSTSPSSTSARNIVTNTGRPNFTIPLMVSLLAGNLRTAVLLCLHGDCDFMFEGLSLLAEVISLDATSPIANDRVDTLLSLATLVLSPSSRDDLFWRCEVHQSHGRQSFFTAFHSAVSPQANGARIASETFIPAESNRKVLDHVLRNFHEPQFLNAQVDRLSARFPGDTALHIAAREGCLKSIEMILHGPYGPQIDCSLLNVYNQTFLDLSIIYYENAINESEDLLMCLGNLFTATAAAKKIKNLASTIYSFLFEYECNISVFCLVVVRRSDNSFLFTRRPRVQFFVAFPNEDVPECHTLFSGDDSDGAELIQLEIGSLIPFVDTPSDFGKVLSAKTREFIEGFE